MPPRRLINCAILILTPLIFFVDATRKLQAEEIIAYLQKKGEITKEYADQIAVPAQEGWRTQFWS